MVPYICNAANFSYLLFITKRTILPVRVLKDACLQVATHVAGAYNIAGVISHWHDEGKFYNLTGGCAVGHECNRYIQVYIIVCGSLQ